MHRRGFLRAGFAAGLAGLQAVSRPGQATAAPPPSRPLRLDSNENALGLSPLARQAVVEALEEAGRYPFSYVTPLVEALANRHSVETGSVVLGNGSSEVIQMAVQAFAAPESKVIVADPTFEITEGYARTAGLTVEKVPLSRDFSHDLARMRRVATAGSLVYICNPNNPTGTLTSCRQLDDWVQSAPGDVVFLVDEAYYDYVHHPDYWSMTRWISRRQNVVVVRTFSKVFGMAGLRLGYGLAHPETVRNLQRWASDVNTNLAALVAGAAVLQDAGFVRRSLDSNAQGKKILCRCLDELGVEYLPSHANFVLHKIRGELARYIERMRQEGIWVGRAFAPLLSYNRVSIGLPQEMGVFVSTLRMFRSKGWI